MSMDNIEFEDLKEGFYCSWTGSFILIKEIKSKDDILMYHWEYPALRIESVYFSIIDNYINRGINGKKYNISLDKKDRKHKLKMLKSIFEARIYNHRNG